MGIGAIILLSVAAASKISSTITLSAVMADLMNELMNIQRVEDPNGPIYPSLLAVSNYGFLPFYNTYVPYVDTSFEYQVSRGQAQSSGNYQFSIPLFGDFFSDMVLHTRIEAVTAQPAMFPSNEILPDIPFPPTGSTSVANQQVLLPDGNVLNTINPTKGWFNEISYSYQTVDGSIIPDPTGLLYKDMLKYCDYPGERFIKSCELAINGSQIDTFHTSAYMMYRAFRLTTDKVPAYNRAMGQEQPRVGTSFNISDDTREQHVYLDGPQTPKFTQPELSLWIKLLFWFCMDQRQAIPSAAIPYGQRFINVNTSSVTHELLSRVGSVYRVLKVNNYQLSPGSQQITQNGDGTYNLSQVTWANGGSPVAAYEVPVPIQTGGQLQGGAVLGCDLHINHLFTVNEIHKIITNRISYYLVRLYRTQVNQINKAHDEIQLTELKYPIEFMCAGAVPEVNTSRDNPNSATDWWKCSYITRQGLAALIPVEKQAYQLSNLAGYGIKESLSSVLDRIEITVQQTPLYHSMEQNFYADYLPLQWPGATSNMDPGKALIPFKFYNLYDIQPAGSVNASRIREFFFRYEARKLGLLQMGQNQNHGQQCCPVANLIIVATALNFLLVSDGTATIRYIA